MAMRDFFFGVPFAALGDKTAIPKATVPDGSVSVAQGYGPDYQRDVLTDPLAKPIERGGMNWLFNQITQLVGRWQAETVPEWVAPTDNAGVPVSYGIGAQVRYRPDDETPFQSYVSISANNVTAPGSVDWVQTSLGVTAPAFDISKKAATTEFVRNASGNTTRAIAVAANRTAVVNDIGGLIYFTTAGRTLQIPEPSTLGIPNNSGKCIHIFGLTEFAGDVAPAAGSTISYAGTTVPKITIKPGQAITLQAITEDTWFVSNSTADMTRNADFATLQETNGYQKIAGSMIIQKGTLLSVAPGVLTRWTFPIAFSGVFVPTVVVSPINGALTPISAWHYTPTDTYVDVVCSATSEYIDIVAIGF